LTSGVYYHVTGKPGTNLKAKQTMPHYDYECETCLHRYEKFQQMSDPPDTLCPVCGEPVRRLIGTGAGLVFKGSGFYETDYRKKTQPPCPAESGKNSACCEGCPKKEE
jgi:putative FmdB family regulatory protein